MKNQLCLTGRPRLISFYKILASFVDSYGVCRNAKWYYCENFQKLILCFLLLGFCFSTKGQIKTLKVGERLPDISISHTLGHKINEKNLSDINKPIILDFFATTCSSCIALLPHLDSMQRKYRDSLKVFVITRESEKRIKEFLKSNSKVKKIDLTFIVEDSILNQLIKYHTIPHEIWISKELEIKAITSSMYVSAFNIDSFIAGKNMNLPVKDDYVTFDINAGIDNYVLNGRLYSKSIFTGFIDNAPINYSGVKYSKDSLLKEEFYVNFEPLPFLLAVLHRRFHPNRIILNVQDSFKILKPGNAKVDWPLLNTYCYSATFPQDISDSVRVARIFLDFGSHLGLSVRIQKRNVACYELVQIGKNMLPLKSKGGRAESNFYPDSGQPIKIRNRPLSVLVDFFNIRGANRRASPIVVSHLKDRNIDIDLNIKNILDIKEINQALYLYGLCLRKTHMELDMIVVSD